MVFQVLGLEFSGVLFSDHSNSFWVLVVVLGLSFFLTECEADMLGHHAHQCNDLSKYLERCQHIFPDFLFLNFFDTLKIDGEPLHPCKDSNVDYPVSIALLFLP